MAFDGFNEDPFHLDLYSNTFIVFFDIILLPISCVIVTVIFMVWVYQLFFVAAKKKKKKITKNKLPVTSIEVVESVDKVSTSSRSGFSNNDKKPKIDLSLPTLTKPTFTTKSSDNSISKSNNITIMKVNVNELSKSNRSPQSTPTGTKEDNKNNNKNPTKKHQSIPIISKTLSTASIVFGMLFLYFLTIIVIQSIINNHPKCIYIALCFELIYNQRLFLYLYYIYRAYSTFINTVHELSKRRMKIIATTICVVWFIGEIFFITWDSLINECTRLNVTIAIIPIAITETVVSTYCVLLYVSKLKKVYSKENDYVSYKLHYALIKLTTLAAVTISTTFIILSFFPFTFALGLMAIDTPINIICMVLSFGYYDKYYKKLCMPCRRCCERKAPQII